MSSRQRLQQRSRHAAVHRDESQHRRHVGPDHSGALGNAGERDHVPVDRHAPRHRLGLRVGGHDGLRSLQPLPWGQPAHRRRQSRDETIHRQRFHDDARRKWQDRAGRAANELRGRFARGSRCGKPGRPGAGIGISGVHDERADRPGGEMLPANLHRGRREAILREHSGHGCALREPDHQQILAVRLADPGLGPAELHAGNRPEVLASWRLQIDGHCSSTKK